MTSPTTEQCGLCHHQDAVNERGFCQHVRIKAYGPDGFDIVCGCKCVFPTAPTTETPPIESAAQEIVTLLLGHFGVLPNDLYHQIQRILRNKLKAKSTETPLTVEAALKELQWLFPESPTVQITIARGQKAPGLTVYTAAAGALAIWHGATLDEAMAQLRRGRNDEQH
jgi:hypothetical protein